MNPLLVIAGFAGVTALEVALVLWGNGGRRD